MNPIALEHNGVTIYNVRKDADNSNGKILDFHFSMFSDNSHAFDIRNLPGNDWSMKRSSVNSALIKAIDDDYLGLH